MTESIHMGTSTRFLIGGLCTAIGACLNVPATAAEVAAPAKPPTMTDVLAASKPQDWHALDPQNTLYLELASGRVVIELMLFVG